MPWRQALDLTSFDPETVKMLSEVYDEVCDQIETDDGVLPASEAERFAIAKHLVEYAMKGERDRRKLVEYALFKFKFPDLPG